MCGTGAHFFKAYFPAFGTRGNYCELKRLIQGFRERPSFRLHSEVIGRNRESQLSRTAAVIAPGETGLWVGGRRSSCLPSQCLFDGYAKALPLPGSLHVCREYVESPACRLRPIIGDMILRTYRIQIDTLSPGRARAVCL
jgi:hypothetical protein